MIFDSTNSVFFDNGIITIAIDESGNKWIGTYFGLVKFDDTNWTVYTPLNSGLPENTVTSIVIDGFGNKWIGTSANGVSVYKEGGVVLSKKEAQKRISQKVFL